jgi:predicted esterase
VEIADALAACRSGLLLEPSNASLFELAARLVPLCAITLVQKPSFNKTMLPKLFTGAPFQHIPSVDGIDENLLLLFHGLGDNPGPFVALAKTLALPQTSYIALGAPHEVPLSDGGRSWFTVFDPTTFELIPARRGGERRIRSMESTVDALEQLLLHVYVYCGYAPRKIHLFGFSQGGTVAMQLARRCATKGKIVGSCVAIASGLLEEQLYDVVVFDERNCSSNNIDKKIPVLLLHGDKDAVVSRKRVSGTEELMKNEGMEVEMHSIPGKGHTMLNSEAETRIVMQFWAQNLSNRPPPADDDEIESGCSGGEQPSTLIELAPGVASISLA